MTANEGRRSNPLKRQHIEAGRLMPDTSPTPVDRCDYISRDFNRKDRCVLDTGHTDAHRFDATWMLHSRAGSSPTPVDTATAQRIIADAQLGADRLANAYRAIQGLREHGYEIVSTRASIGPDSESSTGDLPGAEWLTPLLTEVSAAIYGGGNLAALRNTVLGVPPEYLEAAGLLWALSSFDDKAPTTEQINSARDLIGDRAPRLRITPCAENPHVR